MIVDCRVAELAATIGAVTRGLEAMSRETIFFVDRGPSGKLRLLRGAAVEFETERPGDLLVGLLCALDVEAERLRGGRIPFHAAVCARGRDAILAAGSSGAGKSTLAAALVARGLDYGSDDAVFVDEDGAVVPFARGIHLRPGARELVPDARGRFVELRYEIAKRPPLELLLPTAEATAAGPLRAAVLAFLDRRGAAVSVRPIATAEATARLFSHALSSDDPARGLSSARRVAEAASARVVVDGGRPREIAEALAELLSRRR